MKTALLHRYPPSQIKETNAAFPYLAQKGIDVLTFKSFNRTSGFGKFFKSLAWIFYAPALVAGKKYDIIYCDDSYPFYPILVKLFCPRSRVVLRIGDLHLMYYYGGLVYGFLHFFERIGWLLADEIIAISDSMADYIQDEIGKRPKVVLDPVDPEDFPVSTPQYNSNLVMFHGVLTRNKNVDLLLWAAEKLPDVDFTIIGDGPDFTRLVRSAPKNVFFYGWCPFKDVYRHISECAIGVALRSSNPGNEYVVTSPFLQYGVMGKPCLVTRRKVFGLYPWQFSGVNELVQKIKELLDRPHEGKTLQLYVLSNHNAQNIAEKLWDILTQA